MKKGLKLRALALLFAILICTVSCASNNVDDGGTTSGQTTTGAAPITPPVEDIKNIVLVIGDGMGIEHIKGGELYMRHSARFADWQSSLVDTSSYSEGLSAPVTTDSAAAATAMATGVLTKNGYVGKDINENNLQTIMDVARGLGKSTGIVTSDYLYGATPAAFSAHSESRNDTTKIISSQVRSGIDLLCGRASPECAAKKSMIESQGYTYCDSYTGLDDTLSSEAVYWQLELSGKSPEVALSVVSEKALGYLDKDEDGFLLVIEQSDIDKFSHSNDIEGALGAVKSLDDTVGKVLEWIGERKDTALLVCADHETGGLSIGIKNGNEKHITVGRINIYYSFATREHTNSKIKLFVWGTSVELQKFNLPESTDTIKNTQIYNIMYEIMT